MKNDVLIHGRFEGLDEIYLCQNNVCIFINEKTAKNLIKELKARVKE